MDADAWVRRTHHRPQQSFHGPAAEAVGFSQPVVGLHRHGELQGLAVRGRESLPRWCFGAGEKPGRIASGGVAMNRHWLPALILACVATFASAGEEDEMLG